ncbi:MAG: NAD(P)-binding domain-containing protein [Anaerolineaceae bacterium]|jgi:trk system potassium uptake protein TrkA|nr:NAD(P)-binding domain-containing protein [Anaerolineaceae bacterium]
MKIIIIGCGRVGSGLAKLLSNRGHQVTMIDSDPDAFERLGKAFKGKTVVGIGFDRQAMLDAGIEKADAFAAVTASDEANAVAARIAKNVFRVPRVAARIYDPRKADIYRRLGMQTISPVALGISRMAELLSFTNLAISESVGSGEVNMVDIEIPPMLVGHKVEEITIPREVHIVALSRGGKTFLPLSVAVFEEGDIVHLAVLATSQDRLKDLVG